MAFRLSSRALLTSALIGLVLAYPAYTALACTMANGGRHITADASPVEKPKAERDCTKRVDGQRAPAKPCPDGGERLPQDKRSPLDNLPPLSPLVA